MTTFQKCLILLGVFVFAQNTSIIAHELGHALTLVATGGELDYIEVSPFSWSYMHPSFDPEPMATGWGGFLWQAIFGVLVFCVLWIAKSRLSLFGLMLAVVSLGSTGVYMLVGAVLRIGDSGSLIRMGISPLTLVLLGSILVLLTLALILPLGSLLRVGKGETKFGSTITVFLPIMLYLLVMLGVNLSQNSHEWVLWSAALGGGLVLVALASVLVHWAFPRVDGPETRRRAILINWKTCVLSIVLGGGVVAGEMLVFPKQSPLPVEPETVGASSAAGRRLFPAKPSFRSPIGTFWSRA